MSPKVPNLLPQRPVTTATVSCKLVCLQVTTLTSRHKDLLRHTCRVKISRTGTAPPLNRRAEESHRRTWCCHAPRSPVRCSCHIKCRRAPRHRRPHRCRCPLRRRRRCPPRAPAAMPNRSSDCRVPMPIISNSSKQSDCRVRMLSSNRWGCQVRMPSNNNNNSSNRWDCRVRMHSNTDRSLCARYLQSFIKL